MLQNLYGNKEMLKFVVDHHSNNFVDLLPNSQVSWKLWCSRNERTSGDFLSSSFFQAYSLVDREVGYCQGSAFIVGLLLMQVMIK